MVGCVEKDRDTPPVTPAPPPAIASVDPTSGPTSGGTTVTIVGSGFQGGATLSIGGVPVSPVTVSSGTQLSFVTPTWGAGAANIVVTNPDGQSATATGAFTFGTPTPALTSVSPTSGPIAGGTTVTISGTGFERSGATQAAVIIGGVTCTGVQVLTGAVLICVTGSSTAVGPSDIVVTDPNTQSGTLVGGFMYVGGVPTITAIAPPSGVTSGGTTVTISGTNFYGGATATIGGVATTVLSVSGTQVVVVTGSSATLGASDVVLTNLDGQSASQVGGFTYNTSGALASGFGTNGVVTSNPSGQADIARAVVIVGSALSVVGYSRTTTPNIGQEWRIEQYNSGTGALVSGFGSSGVVTWQNSGTIAWWDAAHSVATDGTNLYVGGQDNSSVNPEWAIQKRTVSSGALVSAFGASGRLQIPNRDAVRAILVNGSDFYDCGCNIQNGAWIVERRSQSTGAPIAGFSAGFSPATGLAFPNALATDGTNLYVAGNYGQWRIEKRLLSTGALDTNFGSGGVVNVNPGSAGGSAVAIAVDSTNLYVIGTDASPGGGDTQWRIDKRLLSTGALVSGFGTGGVVVSNPSGSADDPAAAVFDGSNLYIVGYDSTPGDAQWRIEKRSTGDGSPVATFASGGWVTINPSTSADAPSAITVDSTSIYVVGYDRAPGNEQWRIEKRAK